MSPLSSLAVSSPFFPSARGTASRWRRGNGLSHLRSDPSFSSGARSVSHRRTEPAADKQHARRTDLSRSVNMPCYYDVDDILMEEEPISAVFQVTANGVGLLDPGAERNSVEKGAKVDLPFWLAHGMLSLEQAVSINVPPCFTQKTRKEIQADAACVDLRVRCPYFYELGCKIVPLVSDKSIGQFLRYAFTSRYKEILSKSHSSSTTTVPKFAPRLTKEEARVFDSARESMTAFKKWRVRGARLQKASILGRKRKTKLPDGSSTP